MNYFLHSPMSLTCFRIAHKLPVWIVITLLVLRKSESKFSGSLHLFLTLKRNQTWMFYNLFWNMTFHFTQNSSVPYFPFYYTIALKMRYNCHVTPNDNETFLQRGRISSRRDAKVHLHYSSGKESIFLGQNHNTCNCFM